MNQFACFRTYFCHALQHSLIQSAYIFSLISGKINGPSFHLTFKGVFGSQEIKRLFGDSLKVAKNLSQGQLI